MLGNIVRNLSSTVVKTKTYRYTEMGVMIFAPVISVLGALMSYNNYQNVNRYGQELDALSDEQLDAQFEQISDSRRERNQFQQELMDLENMDKLESLS